MTSRSVGLLAVCLTACVVAAPQRALAQGGLLTVEAAGGARVGGPQADQFGVGGAVSVGGYLGIAPWLLAGARLRGGLLSNGPAPANAALVDPGTGGFETLSAMLRLRPFAAASDKRNATGLFVEAGGGGAITGKLIRPAVEAGLGYGVAVGTLALSPTMRFMQLIQPSEPLA